MAGTANWVEQKAKATALSVERLQEKMATKAERQKAKEKKASSAAKKQEAAEKRFAKQRSTQLTIKKTPTTKTPKPKAAVKK